MILSAAVVAVRPASFTFLKEMITATELTSCKAWWAWKQTDLSVNCFQTVFKSDLAVLWEKEDTPELLQETKDFLERGH